MGTQEIALLGNPTKLLNRVEVREATVAFRFEPPPPFDFNPGRAGDVILLNALETDSEGNTRPFSIASARYECPLMFFTWRGL
jgi:ferredoxin-NADP reductase